MTTKRLIIDDLDTIDSMVQRLDSSGLDYDRNEEGESTVSVAQRNSIFTKIDKAGSKSEEKQLCSQIENCESCSGFSNSALVSFAHAHYKEGNCVGSQNLPRFEIVLDLVEQPQYNSVKPVYTIDDTKQPLTQDECSLLGDKMTIPKKGRSKQFSSFNPNGLTATNLSVQLHYLMDLDVDVQGFSEINASVLNTKLRQRFQDILWTTDRDAKATWATSLVSSASDFKPGESTLVTFGKTALRLKVSGGDRMGRWNYHLLSGKRTREILVINMYQCCINVAAAAGKSTTFQQVQIMLGEEH